MEVGEREIIYLLCLPRCSFTDVLSCTPTGVSEINDLNYEC